MRRWLLAASVAVLAAGCRYETVPGGVVHLDDQDFSTAWRLDRWTGEMCWYVAEDLSDPSDGPPDPPTLQGCVGSERKRAGIRGAALSGLRPGRTSRPDVGIAAGG